VALHSLAEPNYESALQISYLIELIVTHSQLFPQALPSAIVKTTELAL